MPVHCILHFPAEGGEGFHDTMGFRINADGTLRLFNGQEMACGTSWHSVDRTTEAFLFGVDGDPNVDDRQVTHAIVSRSDTITIRRERLEEILLADPGRIALTLTPNPGDGASKGLGRVRYISLALTYEVPEPTSMVLFATGLAGLAVLGRRRSRRR